MKLIHTSDWHLGQNFFEYDRKKDHDSMINQLAELICNEEPDALIIAGDVYDIQAPNTRVQKEFAEYIVKLHDACPSMTIVCISGNHDNASRHEIHQTPWEALNVHMIGKIDFENLENNIIPVKGKGWVVAVPYTNDRFLGDGFYTSLEQKAKEINGEELPIIYAGHAAITGRDFSGHQTQNDRFIGGIECTGIEEIGETYDYIALGHIHKAQTFDKGRARYCGSPIPVSFDEVKSGYEHGFTVVEIESHGTAPRTENHEVECLHPLVNIPSEGYSEWNEAMIELQSYPADIESYIRLNILLKGNDLLPHDKEIQVANRLNGKKARHITTNPTREIKEKKGADSDARPSLTMEELQKIDPKTILKSYAVSTEREFTKEFDELFDIVFKNINGADHEN